MKKIIFLAAAIAFLTQANAQSQAQDQVRVQTLQAGDVPVVVVTKFQSSYPAVNEVVWTKYGSDYMADYYDNNKTEYYVVYRPTGDVIEQGQGVDINTVPSNVNTYVKTKYKDDKVVKYYKVKDAKGKTVWKGKVEQGYVLFDENGNYIKMEKD